MKAGWEVKPLGDLIEKLETVDPRKSPDLEFDYVDVSSVSKQTFTIEKTSKVTGSKAPSRARRKIRTGDVIFATIRPTLQRIASVPAELDQQICSTGYMVLRAKRTVLPKYLYYYLFSSDYSDAMEALQKGASYPAVTDGEVRQQPIPLPPLEEQQRIVAVLDAAFEGLARARAHATANLQNARELFEAQRKSMLSKVKNSWETVKLDAVCQVDRGSSPRPIKSFVTTDDSGVNWVKIGDTQIGSKYVRSTKQKITREGARKSRRVEIGDFILTNSMTYGRPYIMAINGYIHDGWFVLRLKKNVQSDFFFHLLSSAVVQEQFEALAAGAVVKNISGDLVKKTMLQLPPITEQVEIASALDKAASEGALLETRYQTKLQDLDDLRQSLLQRAFAGELT